MASELQTVDEQTGEIVEQVEPTTNHDVRINTIHPKTFEERKTAFNALNNAVSLDDMGEKKFKITGIIQRPGVRMGGDRRDVPQSCSDTTFVGEHGEGYFSKSDGIAKSAQLLVMTFGESWPEPLTVHVQKTVLPNKNTLKTLVID